MNTYEIIISERRMIIDAIEIFTLFLVACFFVGFIFGFLIVKTVF